MKKFISFLLVIAFIVAFGFSATAETANMSKDERINKLRDIVQSFIDEESLDLTYDSENQWFTGNFDSESKLGKFDLDILLFDDMVTILAVPSLKIPEEYKSNMAVFIALLNNDLFYSHFNMDFKRSEIESFSSHVVDKVFPTTEEISSLFFSTVVSLNNYGDYFNMVANGEDPYQIYTKYIEEN